VQSGTSSIFWVNVLERDGWILISVDDRKLGIVISITENGREYLRVAGFHLGETRFIGERQNILSIKVEQIPKNRHDEMLPKIEEALPAPLRGLPVMFL
jgi:DNA-binding PadR family transcriptional regulator